MVGLDNKRFKNLRGMKAKGRRQSDTQFWADALNVYRRTLVVAEDISRDPLLGKVRYVSSDDHDYANVNLLACNPSNDLF